MSEQKRRITVNICNLSCSLITDETDLYMQQVERAVEDVMRRTHRTAPHITMSTAALHAALTFCDHVFQMQKENEQLRAELEVARKEAQVAAESLRASARRSELLEAQLDLAGNKAPTEEAAQAPKKEHVRRMPDELRVKLGEQLYAYQAGKAEQMAREGKAAREAASAETPDFVNPLKPAVEDADKYPTFFEKK